MTYVIAEPCIDVKDLSCIEVCHRRLHPPDRPRAQLRRRQPTVHRPRGPDACVEACPVDAIFADDQLPVLASASIAAASRSGSSRSGHGGRARSMMRRRGGGFRGCGASNRPDSVAALAGPAVEACDVLEVLQDGAGDMYARVGVVDPTHRYLVDREGVALCEVE